MLFHVTSVGKQICGFKDIVSYLMVCWSIFPLSLSFSSMGDIGYNTKKTNTHLIIWEWFMYTTYLW